MNSRDEMMVDSLQSAPIMDYYNHRDLSPKVMQAVRTDPRPFLALVAAPASWDVATHPSLPIFGVFKTNDRDNEDMPAPTHWQLVFTAPGREDIALLPWEESEKLPLATPPVASPPPPGTQPKVTYSFDQGWRDVAFSRLPPGPKEWKVVLHAGDFLSNPLTVRVAGIKPDEASPAGSVPARKPASAFSQVEHGLYVRHAAHPPAPDSGVVFAEPVSGGLPDKPTLMLWGAFTFTDPPVPKSEFLQVHLVFTAPDIPGGKSLTIAIPLAFVEITGKGVKGRFGLDLAQLFRGPSGKVQVPTALHLTAVRGSYIGKPQKVFGK